MEPFRNTVAVVAAFSSRLPPDDAPPAGGRRPSAEYRQTLAL